MQALLPQYQFLALIGRGGMGAVYQVRHLSLNRTVAIKVLPTALVAEAESDFATRFRLEAKMMAKLSHPGIVSVFDSGEASGLLYIVMEYVDGTDMARMIQSDGKLPPEQAVALLAEVCDALHYAHQNGIVHRDLKPANLLVTREGRVKIADFGLAKHHDETLLGLTKTNVTIGTPDFLAPEAWTPGTVLDARADLYSLGVTLYQMLTGEVPRGLWKMPCVKVGVDARFDAIIDKAMQPERAARYQSSTELRGDLERIRTEPRSAEHHSTRGERSISQPSDVRRSETVPTRHRILGMAALVVLLLTFVWFMLAQREAKLASSLATNATPIRPVPTVRDAARWLVQERAEFRIVSNGRELAVSSDADLPDGDFQIVTLSFDRWQSSPPKPPPPEKEFEVLRAVKTLRHAYLRLPGVTDAALTFLAGNLELKTLTISGSKEVTEGVLAHLANLPNLESLVISHAPKLTGRSFPKAGWIASIQEVDFLNATLDADAIRVLTTCPRLRMARLEGTAITAEGLRALASVRTLTGLSVGYCANLTERDFVELLPEFRRLTKLELVAAPIGNEAIQVLATLTNLVTLSLAGTQIEDEGLAMLSDLSRLKMIYLHNTRVTLDGLEDFELAHPQCRIER